MTESPDLGGRNTLLCYKDRRADALDLAQADPEALDRFTGTGSIGLTGLFKDADVRADAIRRMQAIHRKARELLEERGIRAGYLAVDLARWDELFLEPAAPVLLRSPEDDYSVLDADSSQRNAIDAVLAGQSLVIYGPPGTGKSQTIASPNRSSPPIPPNPRPPSSCPRPRRLWLSVPAGTGFPADPPRTDGTGGEHNGSSSRHSVGWYLRPGRRVRRLSAGWARTGYPGSCCGGRCSRSDGRCCAGTGRTDRGRCSC